MPDFGIITGEAKEKPAETTEPQETDASASSETDQETQEENRPLCPVCGKPLVRKELSEDLTIWVHEDESECQLKYQSIEAIRQKETELEEEKKEKAAKLKKEKEEQEKLNRMIQEAKEKAASKKAEKEKEKPQIIPQAMEAALETNRLYKEDREKLNLLSALLPRIEGIEAALSILTQGNESAPAEEPSEENAKKEDIDLDTIKAKIINVEGTAYENKKIIENLLKKAETNQTTADEILNKMKELEQLKEDVAFQRIIWEFTNAPLTQDDIGNRINRAAVNYDPYYPVRQELTIINNCIDKIIGTQKLLEKRLQDTKTGKENCPPEILEELITICRRFFNVWPSQSNFDRSTGKYNQPPKSPEEIEEERKKKQEEQKQTEKEAREKENQKIENALNGRSEENNDIEYT